MIFVLMLLRKFLERCTRLNTGEREDEKLAGVSVVPSALLCSDNPWPVHNCTCTKGRVSFEADKARC
jgi:hypothetical protein